MAVVLKLRRNTTDMSLMDGDTGAALVPGWAPAVARPRYGRPAENVVESMPIRIKDSSQDNLAAELQELHQMQMWAEEYLVDRGCEYPVWLHAKLNSETGERRAWAKRITADLKSGWYDPESINNEVAATLTVERGAYWEGTAENAPTNQYPVAGTVSFTADYTAAPSADVVGDVPARVSQLALRAYDATDQIGRVWIGIRSANKHGTVTNFVNIWELEDTDAAFGAEADATVHDATASPGGAGHTCVSVTPAAENVWVKQVTIQLADVTSNYSDNFGNFLWLLRAKVGHASSVYEVQLRFGYTDMADADHVMGPIIQASGTSWNFYEAGQCGIPLRDLRSLDTGKVGAVGDGAFQIEVWARRTTATGAGLLYLDCLCPIPVDESWLIVKDFTMTYTDADNKDQLLYGSSASELLSCAVYRTTAGVTSGIVDIPKMNVAPGGLTLPPGDGRAIIAYARETTSDITDVLSASFKWFDRWLTLRGAE